MSSYRAYAKYFFHMYRTCKSVILYQNLDSVKSKLLCMEIITIVCPYHRLNWCSVKVIIIIFLCVCTFLKLNLIFHSISFRYRPVLVFVFRVIILLDEIFSCLFESSHFIIIKIVVDFL